ncbi:MAG: serine/threonine protein kinase [bacterium]|nr:MAG: serine/threonine protein kinase [bacterium]
MKLGRWQEVERIFNLVSELEPTARKVYLDDICAQDLSLRKEVESLLACDEKAANEDFLKGFVNKNNQLFKSFSKVSESKSKASKDTTQENNSTKIELKTDRFVLQKQLGFGGFGVVYQAYDKEYQTSVALKILRLKQSHALYRFKREFRTLAGIAHPNLVSLYELINDGDNWFFTMELVEGISFLRYLEEIPSEKNFYSEASTVEEASLKL